MRLSGVGCLWMMFLLALAGPAVGQGWVVDAAAGAAEYEAVAGEIGTTNAILGVRRDGGSWLSLYGGIPLDSAAAPWASAGGGTRWSRWWHDAELGFDAAALSFGYRIPDVGATGGGATLIALPFVGYSLPIGRFEARTGVLHHVTVYDGQSSSRTIFDTAVHGAVPLSGGALVRPEGRLAHAPEAAYPFAGATVELTRGRLTAWASAGRWLAEELDASEWGVGGRIALPGRLAVRASYERESDDPLYWNGARSSWSVGISRALGRRPSFAPGISPPETFRTPAGTVTLRVPEREAEEPLCVAGDFTKWNLVPMRLHNGSWEADFVLAPGIYYYSFQQPDGSWFLPASVQNRVDDGFGGANGVLVVVEP